MKIEKKKRHAIKGWVYKLGYIYLMEYCTAVRSNIIEDDLMVEMFLKY